MTSAAPMNPQGSFENIPNKPRRIKGLIRLVLFLSGLLALALILGFVYFAYKVDTATPSPFLSQADGVVVLTGPGGNRLNSGAELLAQGMGERLLISGVNPSVSAEDIANVITLPDPTLSCCVDLGYTAEDTLGNAYEAANWAQAYGYETIILVTSSYHMPRAKAELSKVMGGVRILAYPVAPEDNTAHWTKSKTRFKLLLNEYGKLLVSYARHPGKRPNKPVGTIDPPDLSD